MKSSCPEVTGMVNIILCGGVGERLWPMSRTRHPKQFIRIIEGKSLLQHTALRNHSRCASIMVVTNSEQYFMARDQMDEIDLPTSYILETVGRNTAPAIALACLTLPLDEMVLVTPSDHHIQDLDAYEAVLDKGMQLGRAGGIVTFGIRPDWAETGYGYIQAEGTDVLAFKEKPDPDTARAYVESGDYFWNSGIFLFRVDAFLEELSVFRPDVMKACRTAIAMAESGVDYLRIPGKAMSDIPKVSVDYAVMEKSKRIRMIPSTMRWSDLGSFESVYDALDKDSDGNVVLRHDGVAGSFINVGSGNNFIYSESKKVAAIDISGLIIVDTRDALLVGLKSSSQKVKDVVEVLKREGSLLKDYHVTEYRPWGSYMTLESGYHYKMRVMTVKPGRKLGSHKHFHRNEHWIVVNGTAEIEVGAQANGERNDRADASAGEAKEEVRMVCENQSTYIPAGLMHRIGNPGRMPLVMVEVQSGDYLEEDDILRIDE